MIKRGEKCEFPKRNQILVIRNKIVVSNTNKVFDIRSELILSKKGSITQ